MSYASVQRRENGTSDRQLSREREMSRSRDVLSERSVDLEPLADSWKELTAGSVVPLGLAGAAAFTSYVTTHERVAITAWIAVAVVGSAAVIAAATASRHRHVTSNHTRHGARNRSSDLDRLKQHPDAANSPQPVGV